jgi:hypothetical protein
VDRPKSVFATVPVLIFVLDHHREPGRVCVGLPFDIGQRPALSNDLLFGIIFSDPCHLTLQIFSAPMT